MAFGAEEIPRQDFLNRLTEAIALPDRHGHWQLDIP
jgi:Leu/Phe-tRNA-protein transferase